MNFSNTCTTIYCGINYYKLGKILKSIFPQKSLLSPLESTKGFQQFLTVLYKTKPQYIVVAINFCKHLVKAPRKILELR